VHYPDELTDCALCPRECHANRVTGPLGWCKSDASFNISSICIHKGEEPVISGAQGICNVFFEHCNLQCIYCQNHQISDNSGALQENYHSLGRIVSEITSILDRGINLVGFVSPSHNIPQMLAIIEGVRSAGYNPRWVYNTNGYDSVSTLKKLEGTIDIYLPDFKYMDREIADEYSGANDYPDVAMKALKEMFRQKGAALHLSGDGTAQSGMLIRHLVLPGQVKNSLDVLRFIAGELSPKLHISLMSQYYPAFRAITHRSLGRCVEREEYQAVCREMEDLGIFNGWVQEFESSGNYLPDFRRSHPFEG
jgi:putative pyruvate formate lyase activating enzyme